MIELLDTGAQIITCRLEVLKVLANHPKTAEAVRLFARDFLPILDDKDVV